jgi:hypothetical protein
MGINHSLENISHLLPTPISSPALSNEVEREKKHPKGIINTPSLHIKHPIAKNLILLLLTHSSITIRKVILLLVEKGFHRYRQTDERIDEETGELSKEKRKRVSYRRKKGIYQTTVSWCKEGHILLMSFRQGDRTPADSSLQRQLGVTKNPWRDKGKYS